MTNNSTIQDMCNRIKKLERRVDALEDPTTKNNLVVDCEEIARNDMADVELVIKIPEKEYYDALQYVKCAVNTNFEDLMIDAIQNGTPLPKGHGRLIDEDTVDTFDDEMVQALANAQTIIEADRQKVRKWIMEGKE